jgi:hypothetical protein
MVTLSPTLGKAPLPSWRIVFETPIIAAGLEKLRAVDNVAILVEMIVEVIRRRECENMRNLLREGRSCGLYGSVDAAQIR